MDEIHGGSIDQSDYLSYLLRLWKVGEDGPVWRASLESSHSGERTGFAQLDDLFDFLRNQTGATSEITEDQEGE